MRKLSRFETAVLLEIRGVGPYAHVGASTADLAEDLQFQGWRFVWLRLLFTLARLEADRLIQPNQPGGYYTMTDLGTACLLRAVTS
jgi:hypothetical protein